MPYTAYIPRNSQNLLYIGQTSDLSARIKRHKTDGALFVRKDSSYQLVYAEQYPTQLEAMRREKQLKGWRRAKKEALITGNLELLKRL